ncbi:hypothetical protein LZ023_29885 [Pseudomonas silvicola]|uniref:hypothetical protein n=1 Tax=Pseudomonas sp. RIT-To-2 TaxID=3462541 RepID=UPI00227D11D6|nr:hypothetical protein LZ023_29885 [Pseudomonas silvicola]
MHIERLGTIQHDLEHTAAHLEALSRMLEGHALFLRRSTYSDNTADIAFLENHITGLAASVTDLRGVAQNIAKVA